MSLFDTADYTLEPEPDEELSVDLRRTRAQRIALAQGKHPANGLPVNLAHTCGECAHFDRYRYHSRTYNKCDYHRLGQSHSAASDMRASWPACPYWTAESDQQ